MVDLDLVVSADWSKGSQGRAATIVDFKAGTITPIPDEAWTLQKLLDLATSRHARRVLVCVDVVLGVPAPFFALVQDQAEWRGVTTFPAWIERLHPAHSVFTHPAEVPEQWSVHTPFYRIPAGEGMRRAYEVRAGFVLSRRIDRMMNGKPPFVVSGIPGSVGAGTRSFWKELAPALRERQVSLWPFHGSMEECLALGRPVIAESYPAISYALAVGSDLPAGLLQVNKTSVDGRERVLRSLRRARWVEAQGLVIEGLDEAAKSEDVFDSLLVAAAVARAYREKLSIEDTPLVDRTAEGGMILSNLVSTTRPRGGEAPMATAKRPSYPCPIQGCSKVFVGSRGGWDRHIEVVATHKDWHPGIKDADQRKALFRAEFEDWFGKSTRR